MAGPRQCPAPRFGRGGRLCATVAAARPGPGRAPLAGGCTADGNRPDGDPARTRRVLHPAARRMDCPTDGRLPSSRRARDLLRDGLVRGTHLPRDPVEAGGGRPRHARRPPLRDRDLRIPSHLLPERGRPRVRVRGRTVLRTHRPQDAESLGRHPEPQPRECHPVSGRAVPLERESPFGRPFWATPRLSAHPQAVPHIRRVALPGRRSARIDSAFENRPVSLISRLLLTASSMRANRRAEGVCHRLPSAWLTLILAGLVVLSVPFATASLQRATAPPPVPSSPHRALTMNAAFLRGVTGSFTENRGQLRDGDVRYTFAAGGLRVGMVPSGLLIGILADGAGTSAASSRSPSDSARDDRGDATAGGSSVVRIACDGPSRAPRRRRGDLPARSNYCAGSDPSRWRAGVTSYREVVYEDLYDGMDLVYRSDGAGLKYEFVVRPGADPDRIRWSYQGVVGLEITAGAVVVRTNFGEFEDAAPIAFQGEREVRCSYSIEGRSVGFRCSAWDPTQALTIDPLLYSTFLGGSTDARGLSLAVDASGDAYITGYTLSADFPTTPGAYRTSIAEAGTWDAFVVKLNPSGTAPVYSTFLGGSNNDRGFAIAVDGAGDAYVAGYTNSSDFPTTPGALRTSFASGGMEGFVTKLNAAGNSLLYSTFLGGTADDRIYAIALDANGEAFVTGRTKSPDFPITAGAFDPTFQNTICGPLLCAHGFVSKLDANGSAMAYSSYLGGRSSDRGLGIAAAASGDAYVAGYTNSSDFPVTPGASGTEFHAGACGSFTCSEGFVARVNPTGTALAYSTFLGGSKTDLAHEVAIDSAGAAYLTGETNSTDFPVTPGAYESTYAGAGNRHTFVTKLDATGSTLVYSTCLEGSNTDQGHGITVDTSGNAYVVGRTNSSDFPIIPGALDTTFGGGATNDVFVPQLGAAGTKLLYSTFLGGGADDWGNAITLDASANVYVTGHSRSSNFPTTPGAFRTAYSGFAETFVAKLSAVLAPAVKITSPSSGAVANTSATVTGTSLRATLVQVRVGSAVWTNATGVASWTVTFDLSPFPNGPIAFEARAFHGTVESAHDSITIQKAPAALALDRCTVRPDVAAIQVGGTQAFAASGWNGTTEIAGASAAWSVTGNIGSMTPGGG